MKRNFTFVRFSLWLAIILIIASWATIIVKYSGTFFDLFNDQNLAYAKTFFAGLFGFGESENALTNPESWIHALKLTWDTIQMSIMAIGFATIAMFLTVIPAARNIANGSLSKSKNWYNWPLYALIRGTYIFSRAVPELVWAMIIIFIFKPGILPGAIALALHNFGIVGKLCAEVVEDINPRPINNLAAVGASKTQMLFYGIMPAVLPKFLTYILYRWEVIIRTTIVVGFVGAGGLGQQFKLSMSYLHYTDVTVILICYILLVWLADLVSELSRKYVK